ncbi:MAG: RNA polymerase sigma factor [Acidobacteriota bacterium]|nr:RNA polymerase sigma factor [Acidobacteriota bacterium]
MQANDPQLPDAILVTAAIMGDLSAFETLVKRYRPAVMRLARAIVGREDAEDVAQDAFLLAFKALPSIEEPEHFAAWLRAVTRRHALRYRERRGREPARPDMDAVLLDQIPALREPLLEDREAEEAVEQALIDLPPDLRLPLIMKVFDDLPLTRIAAFLDVPVSTVKWRIYNARQTLRALLPAAS